MLKSITHVGSTVFDFSGRNLSDAIRAAEVRYASLGVSGITVMTPQRFAQLFEGDPETVDALYAKVQGEWPGADMRLIDEQIIPSRRFQNWRMAYFGDFGFLDRLIDATTRDQAIAIAEPAVTRLHHLLHEFAREGYKDPSQFAAPW